MQIHQNKRILELEQKISKHQHIEKYESITDREALEKQEKKIQKKVELKKQQQIRDKLWHAERNKIHKQDLETRKHEWEQKKQVKTLQKIKHSISSVLQISILNSEIAWKTDQEELKKLFSL